jgi:16S rRNA (cytidine1402-2'-O)-methyltransferase
MSKIYPLNLISNVAASKAKKALSENCTQLFIETPYRNNPLLLSLLKTCQADTKLCIAYNLTSSTEWVKTKSIAAWKKNTPELPKEPAIFLLGK